MTVVLWMAGAWLSFSLMAIGGRELSAAIGIFQLLFLRSCIGLFLLSVFLMVAGELSALRCRRLHVHALRNVAHFAAQYGWFWGIALLPLAEVFALEFTVPLWTLLIAAVFLRESFTRVKLAAVLVGLCGVYIILQPGSELFSFGSVVVLLSATGFAIMQVSTKYLLTTNMPITILFYMCVMQASISAPFALALWKDANGIQWLWIVVVGCSGLSAHYCLNKAMRLTEATAVATLDFFRLPCIALVGILLYDEQVGVALLVGSSLMFVSNVLYGKSMTNSKKHYV